MAMSTIGRWVKTVLLAAGINTVIFKVLSMRAAVANKAKTVQVPN